MNTEFNLEMDSVRRPKGNMVAAESRGMITIGRWAKKFKVSAVARLSRRIEAMESAI